MDEHSPKKRTPLMRYSIHTDKQEKAIVLKSLRSKITFILKRELVCVCAEEVCAVRIDTCENIHLFGAFNRSRISSVRRALDCRAGGRGFDSQGRTSTQGLKITEK